MITNRNSDLGFTAWFDSIYEIKPKQHNFHREIKFLSNSSLPSEFGTWLYVAYNTCIICAIIDKIKSTQIKFKKILNLNPIYSNLNLNKILNPAKFGPLDSHIIPPGLKTFIMDECSGRYKINTTWSNYITSPQSGQGGSRGINIDAS